MKNSRNSSRVRNEEERQLLATVLESGGIHGFKYLSGTRPFWEKLFWLFFISLAFVGAAHGSYRIWMFWYARQTRTTIVSTYFKYANVPFPSVTVCDATRVDWKKASQMKLEDIGIHLNSTAENFEEQEQRTKANLRMLLAALSTAQFGASKDLEGLKNIYRYSHRVEELDVSELLLKMVRPCEEFFSQECWWRNKMYNCCSLFELQKTGYGYCYSFNSDISEMSKLLSLNYGLNGDKNIQWIDWNKQVRPRRTAGRGPWSALRITVNAQHIPHAVDTKPGIIVIIGDPSGFPFENDVFIPGGRYGSVSISGDAVIATDRLQQLSASKRRCLFPDEARILHRGYLRQNCVAHCYRKFMEKNCKCSLDFIYFKVTNRSEFPPCNVEDLKCLAEYNYAFSNLLTTETITYDRPEDRRSFCDCPDDCRNQKYIAKIAVNGQTKSNNEVTCDIHYQRSFCTLYRTDVAWEFSDALVKYGSIFGLFLGGSLLSLAEMFYALFRNLWCKISSKVGTNKVEATMEVSCYVREFQQYGRQHNAMRHRLFLPQVE